MGLLAAGSPKQTNKAFKYTGQRRPVRLKEYEALALAATTGPSSRIDAKRVALGRVHSKSL